MSCTPQYKHLMWGRGRGFAWYATRRRQTISKHSGFCAPRGFSRSLKGIAADFVALNTATCCSPLVLASPPRASWSSLTASFEPAELPCSLSSWSVLIAAAAAALNGLCVCLWYRAQLCCSCACPQTGLCIRLAQGAPAHRNSLAECMMARPKSRILHCLCHSKWLLKRSLD